ncbi:MAG: phosphoribosylamine--glycine ligase [Cyanobacterium sp. T60_A2020_053]|nr:phosphoribosylamine--glycine ligase [Cyanobacterium sp. T60_A2020_053]
MRILVVGNGGREHALTQKLLESPTVERVFCTPGNGGTAVLKKAENIAMAVDDFESILSLIKENFIDLVVVGPELPLSLGITDYLQEHNVKVFGPTKAGATIEASKSWAKALMKDAFIPTAEAETFQNLTLAQNYIKEKGAPIVIKADGLAAGKGVVVAMSEAEALEAVEELFAQNFSTVVIEEFLTGQEVSVLALCDGQTVIPLIPAQDHKQIGEGDKGANTGGMGAYAPTPLVNQDLLERITREILEPTLKALQGRGIDYRGVLYAGLMITPEGAPKTLEFNCRFGDPETQAVLPMLKTPLADVLLACAEQRLADFPPLEWHDGYAVCVVASSAGYPGSYDKGKVIFGIDTAQGRGALVFHAGTKLNSQGDLLTDGGRVLGVTSRGNDLATAINFAYDAIQYIDFEGIYYRRDIGHRVLKGQRNVEFRM